MAKLGLLDILAIVLVVVGGLNWGLYAFGYNLVSMLLGWMPILGRWSMCLWPWLPFIWRS